MCIRDRVNLVVYTFFNSLLGERLWLISMTLSIGLSILFAYIVNRKFVFKSKNPIWPEIFHFFASRLLISFLFEVVTFQLIYNVFKFRAKFLPDLEYAKLIGQIAVVIGNYPVSYTHLDVYKRQCLRRVLHIRTTTETVITICRV